VSSLVFRCEITVESKLTDRSTKFAKRRCRAEQWRCGNKDHGREENSLAHEIAPRLCLEILAANAAKRWRHVFGTSPLTLAKPSRLIIVFNRREAPAVTSWWRYRLHMSFVLWLAVAVAMPVPTTPTTS